MAVITTTSSYRVKVALMIVSIICAVLAIIVHANPALAPFSDWNPVVWVALAIIATDFAILF